MSKLDLDGIGMTSRRTRERLVNRLAERGITDPRVLEAIAEVPRHIFIDEALSHRAYEDSSLPIGLGQTISQPYVVALMTQTLLADLGDDSGNLRLLEVGTGSGYQTAVLASLGMRNLRLYSMERLAPLMQKAETRLKAMGCRNVRFRHSDGYAGWPEEGPFDAILVTAAPRTVPDELLDQLKPGGRMVLPVGDEDIQELRIVTRSESGFETKTLQSVRFVPLLKGTR